MIFNMSNFKVFMRILSLISVGMMGCQQQQLPIVPDTEAHIEDSFLDIDAQFDAVSKALALIMEDSEFRILIKTKAMLQFDGDYDVLISHILDHRFTDGQLLQAKLFSSFSAAHNLSPAEATKSLERILENNPLLTLSIPVNIEKWDAEHEFIPVIIRPYTDKGMTHVRGYKQNWEEILLPIDIEPDFPVLAVGENERCDENGVVKPGLLPVKKDNSTSSLTFNEGQQVELWQVNVPNLSAVEPWLWGKPEFFCSVRGGTVVASGSSATGQGYILEEFHFTGDRNQFDPQDWYVMNKRIVSNWNDNNPGLNISFSFMEEDQGLKAKFTLKLFEIEVNPSASVSWWPSWLTLTVGPTLTIEELGANTTGMGTATASRDDVCWTDYYTGGSKNGPTTMRFYLNCP